jgi:hypothetical protein
MNSQIVPDNIGNDDQRPLPFLVAEKWGFALYAVYEDNTTWYSITDWIAGLTSTKYPGDTWGQLRKTPDMESVLPRLRQYPYGNGTSQFIDDKGLYRIAIGLRATKNRTSLPDIKDFLAKAGAFVDLIRRDPEAAELSIAQKRQDKYLKQGKTPEWIASRELGIVTRKQLMAMVYDLLGTDEHMAAITNDTYQGVFGMNAQELRVHIGIPSTAILRDHFSTMALVYTQAAEEASRIQLENYDDDDYVAPEDIRAVVSTLSRLVGKQVKEMSKMLGIDIVTGQRLLGSGLSREEFMKTLEKFSKPTSKLNPFSGED